ncbi:hypothetical protein E2562_009795 [Oryza meyeriana var. granulata]|uniref:RRM domain-containing protein n=1 Tax=Oryza meyeriana var. granulata TaxID=110450 RepID=A0A6G1EAJ9_9ORYZ|nr:hypothetical protein E2562_009795 [Oryza meyeriana var. granulata]
MSNTKFLEKLAATISFVKMINWTGDSRGFAFVRYKYEDEAQKAVDRLDGRVVDGREIMVQFAKYGPNAERMKNYGDSSKVKGSFQKPQSKTGMRES